MPPRRRKAKRAILATGSEECYDVICGLCENDGQQLKAAGFCTNCQENLCVTCIKYHKKMPALKDHVIQNTSVTTSRKPTTFPAKNKDPLIKQCPRHPDEVIKFYCYTHSLLACSVCVPLDHRTCKDVSYIPEISNGVTESAEFKQLRSHLNSMLARINLVKNQTKLNEKEGKTRYSAVVADIKKFRQDINALLEKLEKNLLQKASDMNEKHSKSVQNTVAKAESAFNELKKVLTELDEKRDLSQNNGVFIAMKYARDKVPVIEKDVESAMKADTRQHLNFQHNSKLDEVLVKINSLGILADAINPGDRKMKFMYDIFVKSREETNDSSIAGSVILPDGRLAVTDFGNKSVKLIDVEQRKISAQVSLPWSPIDLTAVKDDKMAVTLKGKRAVQVVLVSPSLSRSHTISVPGLYGGIEYHDEKFLLVCRIPVRAIHIVDMSGKRLQEIDTDFDGKMLFRWPCRIAMDASVGVMYITDGERRSLICVNMSGDLIFVYEHEQLIEPSGVVLGTDGNVFVCSRSNHTIHQVSPNGTLLRIFPMSAHGAKHPKALASGSDGKFYASCDAKAQFYCNHIKVFQIE